MTSDNSNSPDYKPLGRVKRKSGQAPESLRGPASRGDVQNAPDPGSDAESGDPQDGQNSVSGYEAPSADASDPPSYSELQKRKKATKRADKDWELLYRDSWLARNGHYLTYAGLYGFSILVLLRPYELIGSLSFLSAKAFYAAAITLALYIPTQLITEGNLTRLSTEVKAALGLVAVAILTMPVAKDFGTAWESFNDIFIKAIAMFVVMVNVLRTRARLLGMMWLSLAVAVYLSYTAVGMFSRGEVSVEGYRVAVNVGGMFGNPNDMAMHLVMMAPLALALGISSKRTILRVIYFAMTGLFVGAITVTYSRGGFLAILAVVGILVWKLGRKSRLKISLIALFCALIFIILAPGNYGQRMLSIFIPSLDSVGSSGQRRELLIRSIIVTLRNPWGIGIGNFPIVGVRNLGTHNSYTQVSAELGLIGLACYLTLILSPFRKLFAMERRLHEEGSHNWFYYMSIGFQASIVGFMVSSFFAAVAYNWFIYYLIAYAVAFRRIYQLGLGERQNPAAGSGPAV